MTETQAKALMQACDAMYEAIKATGDAGIPSGHLYAALVGKVSLSAYQAIIGALVKAGKITDKGYLLRAVS